MNAELLKDGREMIPNCAAANEESFSDQSNTLTS